MTSEFLMWLGILILTLISYVCGQRSLLDLRFGLKWIVFFSLQVALAIAMIICVLEMVEKLS